MYKTAHLQTAQADTRPKLAKELVSCHRIRFVDKFLQLDKFLNTDFLTLAE